MAKIEIEIDTSEAPEVEDEGETEGAEPMKAGEKGRVCANGRCGTPTPKGVVRGRP